MTTKENDVLCCPDSKCGCEVKVTKASAAGAAANKPLSCCCGKAMAKK